MYQFLILLILFFTHSVLSQTPWKIVFDTLLNKPILFWDNGDRYIGTYTKHPAASSYDSIAHPEGNGTFKSITGGEYVGFFINGKKSGEGTLTYRNGSKYIGEFANNQAHEKGVYTSVNGDIYSLNWVYSIKNLLFT